MKDIKTYLIEGYYDDNGKYYRSEFETSAQNDEDIEDYTFEYLHEHENEHNWQYAKMKSFMNKNFKDFEKRYGFNKPGGVSVSLQQIDKHLKRYCSDKK